MDVLRLDPATYLPNALIEDYSSMIWTERHVTNGEFELRTGSINATRNVLPEGSMISLLDSKEVMLTETHSISVDDDGIPELTIKGRTVETLSDNRIIDGAYKESRPVFRQYTTSEMVSLLLWNNFINATGEDPAYANALRSINSVIPNFVVTDSTTLIEAARIWWLEQGNAYTAIRDFLGVGKLGIRNIRPPGTAGNVMSFDISRTDTRGAVLKTPTNAIPQLRLDVYNGLDRTRQQSVREPVIFHYNSGHIESPKYLFSNVNYKNLARVVSSIGTVDVWAPGVSPSISGLALRILHVNGGDQGDQLYNDFLATLIQKAQIELSKHRRDVIFDGAISEVTPYNYNQHYFLGDTVTLMAEYDFEAPMVISEFIRTEDKQGDRGYPTLTLSV